jgi:hypothetical protein
MPISPEWNTALVICSSAGRVVGVAVVVADDSGLGANADSLGVGVVAARGVIDETVRGAAHAVTSTRTATAADAQPLNTDFLARV